MSPNKPPPTASRTVPDPDWAPLALPGARTRLLRASATASSYYISIWVPPGPAPAGGFPLLCLLDGQALFGTAVEAVRRCSRRPAATGVHPTAIVGIAHEAADLYPDPLRRRDYSFGPPLSGPGAPGSFGGGAAFLSFIAAELLPLLQRQWPLDAARRTLFGHSLAGMFVLHALAERPQAFRTWAAISPSIWWHPAALQAHLAASLPGQRGPRVFMAAGQWEEELPPWLPPHAAGTNSEFDALVARRSERDMVGRARVLAADMRGWLGEQAVSFQVLPDEDHGSVAGTAVLRVLRAISS